MIIQWEMLTGLIAIAIAIFFGLWSFTRGFRDEFQNISEQLSSIKEKLIELASRFDTAWEFTRARLLTGGTIQRELPNLGKITISASPETKQTIYDINVEKIILRGGLIEKISKETGFFQKELEWLGEPTSHMVLTPRMMRLRVPSDDPKVCTKVITEYLKWLDSSYVKAIKSIEEFENPILQ